MSKPVHDELPEYWYWACERPEEKPNRWTTYKYGCQECIFAATVRVKMHGNVTGGDVPSKEQAETLIVAGPNELQDIASWLIGQGVDLPEYEYKPSRKNVTAYPVK